MRKSEHIAALRQVAMVRDLQRVAAKTEAARAAAALREKDEALTQSERERQTVEDSWRAAMSGPVMQMETMPLWSSALLRHEEDTRQASRESQDAKSELEQRKSGWLTASQRNDIAKDLVEQAVKDRFQAREESTLLDAADRHLHKRVGA